MRPFTILFSIVAHALAVFAVFVSSVIATDVLPDPRRASEFIIVKADVPAPPPRPPARVSRAQPSKASSGAAPLEPPTGVQPERDLPAIDDQPEANAAVGAGLSTGRESVEVPLPPSAPAPQPRAPVPIGGDIRPPVKIRHVAPVYPRVALEAKIPGLVILQAVIGEDGAVDDVKVLRGEPLFNQAAIDAVRQWRFTPTLLNGQPVPVVMTVTVSFALGGR